MDYNGATTEVLASKFGPDGSYNKTHKKNNDWLGRIGDHGSESNRWCGNHSAILRKILNNTRGKCADQWSIDFSVATFDYCLVTLPPFWHTGHDDCVADTLT